MDGHRFQPIQDVIGSAGLTIDVKVQEEKDLPLALATIKVAREQMDQRGNGILYVPVKESLKTHLKEKVHEALGDTMARRVQYVTSRTGFYPPNGGTFNLDLLLVTLGVEKLQNTVIAVQGEYRVSSATWKFFKQGANIRLVVLAEWLDGIMRAIPVKKEYLENIDKVARPAIHA